MVHTHFMGHPEVGGGLRLCGLPGHHFGGGLHLGFPNDGGLEMGEVGML